MYENKNIQISYELFLSIVIVFNGIEEGSLDGSALKVFREAYKGVLEKRASIRNREAYSDMKQAQTDEQREYAFNNYLKTKKLPITL